MFFILCANVFFLISELGQAEPERKNKIKNKNLAQSAKQMTKWIFKRTNECCNLKLYKPLAHVQ